MSGTFTFQFDSTDSNYANQVTSNLPVINTSGSFTTLTSSLSTSGSTTTVTVTYAYTTISDEDGCSFNYVTTFFNDANISNIQITNFGGIPLSKSGSQFRNLNYLTSVTTSSSPTILTGTTVSNMFNSCNQLTTLDLSNWDTSGITDMSRLFYNCQTIASINVSNWNTSNVTTMNDMFFTCPVLETITGLSGWNVANVTNMSNMFTQCYLLSSLNDVSGWNVSNVTNMSNMFSVLSAITSLNLSSWNVSNVLSIDGMFNGSNSLTSIGNVSGWNVSKVTSMNSMFTNCGITSINVSNWNVSNVTGGMNDLFSGCSGLTSLDLTNWNVTNVGYMRGMFAYCTNLTTVGNLYDNWNVTLAVANDQYSDFATFSQLTGNSIPNWANPPTSPPPSPPTGNVCFPAGTPVTTDQGIVPIQDIIPTVHTIRKQPILAITRTALKDDYMVCFEKDSIMKNVPSERTVISPQHKLFYNGHMIEAQYFPSEFDRVTIISYSGEPVYNVLLLDHSKMIVNNMITETLDPENTVAELYRLYENPTRKDQEEYIRIQESYLRTMIELKQTLCKISC
jgi:surface protein